MDLIDITASFKFRSLLVNGQAFSSLLDLLDKERRSTKNKLLFFDCFYDFGEEISGWAFQAIPLLVKNGIFTDAEILMEILTRLKGNRSSQKLLLKGFLSLPNLCTMKAVFQVLQTDLSLSYVLCRNIIEKKDKSLYPALFAIFSCSGVSEETKVLISNFFLSAGREEIEKEEINFSDPFMVVNECQKSPKLLLQEKFPTSFVLLPYMISITKVLSDIEKSLPGIEGEIILRAKTLMLSSMKVALDEVDGSKSNWSNYDFLKYIVEKDSKGYLNLWRKQNGSAKLRSYALTDFLFAASFLPFTDTKTVTTVINEIIVKTPTLANMALNFYLLVMTKPYCSIDKSVILESIKDIACTKYVIDSVVSFLMILAERTGDIAPLKFISEIVLKNQNMVDKVKSLARIQDIDDREKIEERINLLKNMLLVSSRTDHLYPILENYLVKNDPVLGYSIEALVEVSAEEESFDFRELHKLLTKKVRENGNHFALAKYCSFLALCTSLDSETEKGYRSECIVELWNLKSWKPNDSTKEASEVRCAAWQALASLNHEEVLEATQMDAKTLIGLSETMNETEVLGFQKFLKQILDYEVENIPRPVYTKTYNSSDPVLSSSDSWFEALGRSNKESPWVWEATLGLSPHLITTCPAERNKTFCLKLLRRLLSEVPQPRRYGLNDLVNGLASWRMFMKESVVSLGRDRENSLISARDQITEECSKALRQTELCLSNVLFVMTALILEISDVIKTMMSSQRKETEVLMQPWIGASCHFIFPLCDPSDTNFEGLMNPIFQTSVKSTDYSRDVARFCDWMISSFALGPQYFKEVSYSVRNRYDPFTADNPITSNYIKLVSNSRNYAGSRSSLYSLGAALGISPLRLSLLSEFVDDKESLRSLETSLDQEKTPENISLVLRNLSSLSVSDRYKHRNVVKKLIEREWGSSDCFKRSIYEALADYCRITWLQNTESLPMNYDHLPDKSILKDIVSECVLFRLPSCILVSFIDILSSIKRTDQRTLPPLNWAPLLERIMCERNAAEPALKLSIKEKCKMVVYKLSDRILRDKFVRSEYILAYITDLPFVLSCLNEEHIPVLLDKLLELAASEDHKSDQIVAAIKGCRDNSVVHEHIKSKLPTLEIFDSKSVLENVAMRLQMESQYEGEISLFFDFYILCDNDFKFPQLFQIYEATQYDPVCLRVLGFKVHTMDIKEILQSFMILAGVQSFEKSRGNFKDEAFDFFLVLVCSIPTELPIPWTGENDIKTVIQRRWKYYWEEAVLPITTEKLALVIQRFLLVNLVAHKNEENKNIMREMLYSLFPIANTSIQDMLKFDDTERHLLFSSESAHGILKTHMKKIEMKSVF